jgi:citrate lyase beta subunit
MLAMPSTPPLLRTIATALIVPGDRPDRFDKARARCGHAMIIDLEDAVAETAKAEARDHIAAYLQGTARAGPPIGVRLNGLSEPAALDDLHLLRSLVGRVDFLALPKVESARDVSIVFAALNEVEIPIMAIIETVAGLAAAGPIAASLDGHGALAFGGADYAAETGMAMTDRALLPARVRLVEAAAAAGVPVFDVPYLAIGDEDGLRAESAAARELGFTGKLAIHPSQPGPIIEAFAPTADELDEAARIIAGFEASDGRAIQVDGRMVDKPVYQRALALRARQGGPAR